MDGVRNIGVMESPASSLQSAPQADEKEGLSYLVQESADLLGVDYFSLYRLIQRGKLRATVLKRNNVVTIPV